MATSKNMYVVSQEFPEIAGELKLTGSELRFYTFHLTKLFSLTDPVEFNQYLDAVPRLDNIYDRVVKTLPYLEKRIKVEDIRNGRTA